MTTEPPSRDEQQALSIIVPAHNEAMREFPVLATLHAAAIQSWTPG